MRFQAPRGTEDVLPDDSSKWIFLEQSFRAVASRYGYRELRTPTFEDTELFTRTSGDTSDIVTKQMYTFLDKGGRNITLKPEGTAPAMRAMLEHSLHQAGSPSRFSYITPFYRYERPQKGRLREAHQFGLELIGSSSPAADAEVIEATVAFYIEIGLSAISASINSLGRAECRTRYREAILLHAAGFLASQPEDYRLRVEKNPLRLLDSKDPDAQETVRSLPNIAEFLEPESRERFENLQSLLSEAGVPYTVEPSIVRGLDYYTETVFEIQSAHLGAQSALCGGGRYDGLISDIGGPPTPAVGVGMGIERCLIVLDEVGHEWPAPTGGVFVACVAPEQAPLTRELARRLRKIGVRAQIDLDSRPLKNQLKLAVKLGARYVAIVGEEEAAKGVAQMRDLESGSQEEVALDSVDKWLLERRA